MIKFQDNLWYVITASTYDDSNLAYMCHYDKTKACEKRQNTGRRWAQSVERKDDKYTDLYGKECIIPNVPSTGFKLGSVVSRYSTDNKLFRVTDPRGFEVEISAGNVSALLQDSTVINGEVQEECIWGRDSGGNVLVVMDSTFYHDNMNAVKTKQENINIPFNTLTAGDCVSMHDDYLETGWIYHGNVPLIYDVEVFHRVYWQKQSIPNQTIEDPKKVHLFSRESYTDTDGRQCYTVETRATSKVKEVKSKNNPLPDVKGSSVYKTYKRVTDLIDTKECDCGFHLVIEEVKY